MKELAILALFLAPSVTGRQASDPRVVRFEELGLTLTLPPLEGLASAGSNRWRGRLGPSQVEITFKTLPSDKYELREPEDVLDHGPSFWSDPRHGRNDPGARRAMAGPFGFAPYAAWERSELGGGDGGPTSLRFLFGGLLTQAGYWITLEASPTPGAEHESVLFEFLEKGIRYEGPLRESGWSDEEARQRWERNAPLHARDKLAPPARSAHYIVLTNSPAGSAFARKMEECFAAIRKVYAFDDVPGRRLLPVFLFQTQDEYCEFAARNAGMPAEEARRSKGHAAGDCYVTWNAAPGEPVHLHEATHQIFRNRLGLGAAGAWFQEGVAEYVASKGAERAAAAARLAKQGHVPLSEFLALQSLSDSGGQEGPGAPADQHGQAALLIEFLRESKWAKDKFPAFLQRVGRIPARNRAEVEAALQELYGVDLAGLEQRWLEHCRKR